MSVADTTVGHVEEIEQNEAEHEAPEVIDANKNAPEEPVPEDETQAADSSIEEKESEEQKDEKTVEVHKEECEASKEVAVE